MFDRRNFTLNAPVATGATFTLTGVDALRFMESGGSVILAAGVRYEANADFVAAVDGAGLATITWKRTASLPAGTHSIGLAMIDGFEDGGSGSSASNPSYVAPGGCSASASFTPAAAEYGPGDIIDVSKEFAFTFPNGDPVPEGSLIRILDTSMKIGVGALQALEGSYSLQLFSAAQPSAQADNDLWTLALEDLTAYRGSIGLGTPVDLGGALYIKQSNIDVDVKLVSSSAHGRLITTAGFTPTAVARQVILYGIVV